jgi:hypothetical protein
MHDYTLLPPSPPLATHPALYHLWLQDPEIIAMTNLVDAYQRSEITEFERILRTNKWVGIKRLTTDSTLSHQVLLQP